MKDKIITLNGKDQFYVVEELNHKNKKYILTAEYDPKKEEVDEEKIKILRVTLEDEDLITYPVTEEELKEIGPKLYQKIEENI